MIDIDAKLSFSYTFLKNTVIRMRAIFFNYKIRTVLNHAYLPHPAQKCNEIHPEDLKFSVIFFVLKNACF